nr:hypothetical protein [Tanacetum cinerariifolium]
MYKNGNQSGEFGSQWTVNVVGARENFDQNAEDEHDALANLIANLKLDVDENKKIHKKLKKANTSLAHELEQCKSILAETSKILEESNSVQDSCLVALQTKQTEFEKYKAYNDRTVDYDKLKHKLNETLGLLAQKDIDIKEVLKLKAYKILVVKEKHDELVKQSLLTKPHYEGLVKEKIKVIMDLKQKKDRDIDKIISMEKQLQFLNEIVYKRNQTIQTVHMLAPNGPTFNGRLTFSNSMYLKKVQSETPCLYVISNEQSDPTNSLVPDREETLTLAEETLTLTEETQLKLNKDFVRPYDYTKLNSLYEILKPSPQGNHEQLAHANKVRKKMWRKSFVKVKPNIFKNIDFLPVSKSIKIDDLESDKAEFSNMYDTILQECVSNDVMCTYLHLLSDLDAHTELQCLYLHKVKECECLAQKLLKQTESVSKEVYTELLRSFAKLEKHSIYLEFTLHQCQEQLKNDTLCNEQASNIFRKEREEYFKIQDLKAQLQDKNIAICELKKLIDKCKEKSMENKFDKPSVVRQPNSQKIPKPSVLGKPAPFLDSLERNYFSKTKLVSKTNVSEGLSKTVTTQNLPQTAMLEIRK